MPLPTLPKQPKAINPAAQSSLMGAIGRGTMSGIASAANMLSKPSRALWGSANFLAGGNSGGGLLNLIPFSDTMGLTNPNEGVELSKFLGNQGLMSQNDESKWEWMDPVRGLVDIAGDPLSWLGPGALTKAGTKAAKAGTLTRGFLPSIRSGERALVGLQVPFGTKPFATFGSGAKVADNLAAAGKVAAKVPGVEAAAKAADGVLRTGRALFDNTVKGAVTKLGQVHYEDLTKAQKAAVHDIESRLNTVAQILSDAGLDSRADGDILRNALETGNWIRPPQPAELEAYKALGKLREDLFKMQKKGGMHVDRLMDEAGINYWFRQTPDSGKGAGSLGRSGPSSAGDKSAVRRNLAFRGFKEGTHGINKLFTDDEIYKFIDDLRMRGVTKRKDQIPEVANFVAQKYGSDIIQDAPVFTKRGKPVFQKDPTTGNILTDAAGKPLQQVADRYELLADMLTGDSARQWKDRGGVFTSHPLADAMKLARGRAERAQVGSQLAKTLANHKGSGAYTVGDIISTLNQGKIGLDAKAVAKKIHKLQTPPGTPFNKDARRAILNSNVDDDLAAELVKNFDRYTAPPATGPVGKAFDSASAMWKAGMLAWPGRITRDLTSSVARMGEQGWLGAGGGLVDASKILRGQAVDGLEKIPAIEKFLYDAGLEVNPENAQRAYNAMYHSRYGRSNVVGSGAAAPLGTTLDDMTGQLPGQIEQTYPQMFGDAARLLVGQNPATKKFEAGRLNPLNVRGVGGQTESKFGPVAASDVLGGHADDLSRMASDLNLLRDGYVPDAAAKNVNSAFADYSLDSLTPTEQQLRRLFPFYNFTKSQGVHTAKELATRPGGPMAQTIRATADMQDKDPTTPEYVQQTTSIPLGMLDDGTKRYLTGLGLMHEGPLGYMGGGAQGAFMQTMSQMNPLVKMPIEWGTGESFFQRGPLGGRDLGDLDPTIGRTMSNIGELTGMMPEGSGPVRFPGQQPVEFVLGNSPVSRALTTARSLTDTRKGAVSKGLNFLTGARVSDISPAAQDAVLRDAAQAYGKSIGAKEFSRMMFSKGQIADLEKTDPRAAQLAQAFNALQKQLSDRQKNRKKKTAGSPQR